MAEDKGKSGGVGGFPFGGKPEGGRHENGKIDKQSETGRPFN